MTKSEKSEIGLETALEVLGDRYEYDARGRIVGTPHEGVMPRFLLARAASGCVWRFRSDVSAELVREVAKLAGRERGLFAEAKGYFSEGKPRPPERLVMIERLFVARTEGEEPGQPRSVPAREEPAHEWLTHSGVRCAELWRVD